MQLLHSPPLLLLIAGLSSPLAQASVENITSTPLQGFSIEAIDDVLFTELGLDFGFPLSEDMSETHWNAAKQFEYDIHGDTPSSRSPFLLCTTKDDVPASGRVNLTLDLLNNASSVGATPTNYFFPLYVDNEEDLGDATAMPLRLVRNDLTATCFVTSAYTSVIVEASNMEDAQYVVFQPITPSVTMRGGTVATMNVVLSGLHATIRKVSFIMQKCPSEVGVEVNSTTVMEELERYMAPGPDGSLALVTSHSYFVHAVDESEGDTVFPRVVSQRMRYWSNALMNGVEATGGCADTLSRTSIKFHDESFFSLEIEKSEEDASAESKSLAEAGSRGYQDKNCVISILAALGEMPAICVIETLFPISPRPPQDDEGDGEAGDAPAGSTNRENSGGTSGATGRGTIAMHMFVLLGTTALSLSVL